MKQAPIDPTVAEQAVQWLVELQAGASERRRQAWRDWRAAAGEHERAWQRIEQLNDRLSALPPRLGRQALEAQPSPQRRTALKALLVLSAIGATGWGLQRQPWQPYLADRRTAVGERLDLALDDGSQLLVNTDSAVNIRFDARQRLIELRRGEILVHNRADLPPLRIATPQGLVLAERGSLGVRLDGPSCALSLYEGNALVRPLDGTSQRLGGGQRLRFDSHASTAPDGLDPNASAWTRGMLVASGMRLADFLAELNRYRHGRLGCDPAIADLRLSGSYPLDDSERILDLLPAALPVEVHRFTRYWVSVQPRA